MISPSKLSRFFCWQHLLQPSLQDWHCLQNRIKWIPLEQCCKSLLQCCKQFAPCLHEDEQYFDDDTGFKATRKHNMHAMINGDIISNTGSLFCVIWSINLAADSSLWYGTQFDCWSVKRSIWIFVFSFSATNGNNSNQYNVFNLCSFLIYYNVSM